MVLPRWRCHTVVVLVLCLLASASSRSAPVPQKGKVKSVVSVIKGKDKEMKPGARGTVGSNPTMNGSSAGDVLSSSVPSVPVPHKTVKLLLYFFLWYFLTVVYNVSNKIVLNEFPLPVTVCFIQLFLGIPIFLPIWILKWPKGDPASWWRRYHKIGLCHGLGNLASIMSFGAGAVSFTHVIKACEPVFAAVLSRILLHTDTPPAVYLSLVPIVAGVAIASTTELSFTWHGFLAGMASNLFYQLRIVLAKLEMGRFAGETARVEGSGMAATVGDSSSSKLEAGQLIQSQSSASGTGTAGSVSGGGGGGGGGGGVVGGAAAGAGAGAGAGGDKESSLSPSNMFRVLTIIASLQLLPLALVFEGRYVLPAWNAALGSGAPIDYLVTNLLVSGASYYLYNEVAFWILALVSPITHAIGNTIKRVVIIFASVVILKSPINAQGVLGSTIAIIGTLVYSLILQQSDKRKEKKKIASV